MESDTSLKLGRPRRTYPPLTDAQLELCPHGDPKCRLCQLRPDQIKELHKKKFDEEYTYEQIRKYIKETFNMGEDFGRISRHFNKHVLGKEKLKRKPKKKFPEVFKSLEISESVKITTSGELEKAYATLVNMAELFTKKVNRLQEKIAITIDQREKDDELDDELEGVSVMDLLEKQARLNKEAREFLKDVSALRAPKVMVAQFLESFIDSVIKELSSILSHLAGELQYDITAELKDAGQPDILSGETFTNIFRKTALDYRDRMINLKRQKMADALSALQDLEKLI
jgi:hypothetical protein